ncbi:hypothetical protein AA313_de0204128 [Arthrobotrys entomopaga]|nr:hypothetical protein AA313_de0204128 [Arthrobotrys entomopaga]
MHTPNTNSAPGMNPKPVPSREEANGALNAENENKPRMKDIDIKEKNDLDDKVLETPEPNEEISIVSHDRIKQENCTSQLTNPTKSEDNIKAFEFPPARKSDKKKVKFMMPHRRGSTSSTSSFESVESGPDEIVVIGKKKAKTHTKASIVKNQGNGKFTKKILLKPAIAVEIEQRRLKILELEKGHHDTNALIIQLEERCAISEKTITELSKDIDLVLKRLGELEFNNRKLGYGLKTPSKTKHPEGKEHYNPAFWRLLKLFVLVFVSTALSIWVYILLREIKMEMDPVEKYKKHLKEIEELRPEARKFLRERLGYDL